MELFEVIRIHTVTALLYGALPIALWRWTERPGTQLASFAVPAFLRAAFFALVLGVTLGAWHLCFPGATAAGLLLAALAAVAMSRRRSWLFHRAPWEAASLQLFDWLEQRPRGIFGNYLRRLTGPALGPNELVALAIFIATLLTRLRFPLQSYRFLELESYKRALSLQLLVQGADWKIDPSVAWLAPIVHFSGTSAATVIRWTNPLIEVGILAAIGYAAWMWSGRRAAAALLAPVLFDLGQRWANSHGIQPVGAAEIAVLFWMLGVGVLRLSIRHALVAAGLAVLLYQGIPLSLYWALPSAAAGGLLALALALVPRPLRVPLELPAAVFAGLLLCAMPRPSADGPFQYEAAARVANRISAEFPRNTWTVVSPAQELPLVLGRGWHAELSDFVLQFPESDTGRENFRFPFSSRDLFVFVEKRPLAQPLIPAGATSDASSYHYYTQTGRTSLEYQAALIMTAYARSHQDCSIYYQDADLTVYRVRLRDEAAETAL
ncbi:MAG: hypothetical protein JNK87_40810 [Bryobacterales bacterium]|nr:hypothetical protein [Bryobacterales bacterium]